MAMSAIVAICVVVFAVTSAITLLGITKRIRIEKTYLNALFSALILEIVAIGVMAFRTGVADSGRQPYVRITFPISNISIGTQTTLLVAGVAVLRSDDALTCRGGVAGASQPTQNVQPGTKDIFSISVDVASVVQPSAVTVGCTITGNGKVVAADTVMVQVSR